MDAYAELKIRTDAWVKVLQARGVPLRKSGRGQRKSRRKQMRGPGYIRNWDRVRREALFIAITRYISETSARSIAEQIDRELLGELNALLPAKKRK